MAARRYLARGGWPGAVTAGDAGSAALCRRQGATGRPADRRARRGRLPARASATSAGARHGVIARGRRRGPARNAAGHLPGPSTAEPLHERRLAGTALHLGGHAAIRTTSRTSSGKRLRLKLGDQGVDASHRRRRRNESLDHADDGAGGAERAGVGRIGLRARTSCGRGRAGARSRARPRRRSRRPASDRGPGQPRHRAGRRAARRRRRPTRPPSRRSPSRSAPTSSWSARRRRWSPGVADAVRAKGIACFGPSAAAARLEGSKAFAKEVMAAAGVPTARAYACTDADERRARAGRVRPAVRGEERRTRRRQGRRGDRRPRRRRSARRRAAAGW